jgi:hypothetical protein
VGRACRGLLDQRQTGWFRGSSLALLTPQPASMLRRSRQRSLARPPGGTGGFEARCARTSTTVRTRFR